jgi:hypothetical protein
MRADRVKINVFETEEKKSQSDTGEEQQKGGKKLLG